MMALTPGPLIDGDTVIHQVVMPAPVEQVFDMFTDPRLQVRWIGIPADLQPLPGGRFRFEVQAGWEEAQLMSRRMPRGR
jgi:uncharacterized protein YndB with AHSA1/START domain